jgi:hypothetical protein
MLTHISTSGTRVSIAHGIVESKISLYSAYVPIRAFCPYGFMPDFAPLGCPSYAPRMPRYYLPALCYGCSDIGRQAGRQIGT